MALTRRQRAVLDVIRDFIATHGYSPSLEEIGDALGLSSVATVHKHVTHLVEKGYVRRAWNQNRSIEIVDTSSGAGSVSLPLVGRIAAGQPLEAVPTSETVRMPAEMIAGRGRTFVLRVEGNSMIDEQIRDGDLVIVEERKAAQEGETVVALIDGTDATLKRFRREGSKIKLQPANPAMSPIVVDADRVKIQGVVVGVLRRY